MEAPLDATTLCITMRSSKPNTERWEQNQERYKLYSLQVAITKSSDDIGYLNTHAFRSKNRIDLRKIEQG